MDSRISALITKSLDGLSLRSMVTAQNIANANTPNYRPLRVSFENALRAASQSGGDIDQAVPLRLTQEPATGTNGGERMDMELATQSETALRYGALIDVLGRELQLQHTIIRGGQ